MGKNRENRPFWPFAAILANFGQIRTPASRGFYINPSRRSPVPVPGPEAGGPPKGPGFPALYKRPPTGRRVRGEWAAGS